MATVRIPGPEGVGQVAVARDPGSSATGADFGAGIAQQLAHFGQVAENLGTRLHQQYKAAEDDTDYQNLAIRASAGAQQLYQQRQPEATKGPIDFYKTVDADLQGLEKSTVETYQKESGRTISGSAMKRVKSLFANLRIDYGSKAITEGNNARITKITGDIETNMGTVLAGLAEHGDLDGAIGQTEEMLETAGSILSPPQLSKLRDETRKGIGASLQTYLDGFKEHALSAATDEERQVNITAMDSIVDDAIERGYVDPANGTEYKRKWTETYLTRAARSIPAEEAAKTFAPKQRGAAKAGSLVDRIIGVESGGDPTAKNPNSSATGLGQFTSSTWLGVIKKHAPQLMEGKSKSQILALRNDPQVSRAMTQALLEDNAAALRSAGIQATDGNLYLAHFAGSDGATQILRAVQSGQGEKSAASILGAGVARANPFMSKMSAQQLAEWASKKVGSGTGSMSAPQVADASASAFDLLPPDIRKGLFDDANRRLISEERQVQREEAIVEKETRLSLEREGYDLMLGGTLSQDWLDTHRDDIGITTYKTLARSLANADTTWKTDPETYLKLLDEAESDPEQALISAREAYVEKKIARDVFGTIRARAEKAIREDTARPWSKDIRSYVRKSLDFGSFTTAAQKERQINAGFAYDDWIVNNPKASREDAMKQAKLIVEDYRRAKRTGAQTEIPLPQNTTAQPGNYTVNDLTADKETLKAKLQRKEITPEEARRQAKILMQWEGALTDTENALPERKRTEGQQTKPVEGKGNPFPEVRPEQKKTEGPPISERDRKAIDEGAMTEPVQVEGRWYTRLPANGAVYDLETHAITDDLNVINALGGKKLTKKAGKRKEVEDRTAKEIERFERIRKADEDFQTFMENQLGDIINRQSAP